MNKEDAAAATTVATAETMAAENVEQVADKQAAIKTADQEASKKAEPKARQAGIKAEKYAAAAEKAVEKVEQAAKRPAAVDKTADAQATQRADADKIMVHSAALKAAIKPVQTTKWKGWSWKAREGQTIADAMTTAAKLEILNLGQ